MAEPLPPKDPRDTVAAHRGLVAMEEASLDGSGRGQALAGPPSHWPPSPGGEGKTREYYWFGRPAGCATVRRTA